MVDSHVCAVMAQEHLQRTTTTRLKKSDGLLLVIGCLTGVLAAPAGVSNLAILAMIFAPIAAIALALSITNVEHETPR